MGKNRFGIAVIVVIFIFDVLVYAHQKASPSEGDLPLCYPSKDAVGKIKYDSTFKVLSK